MDDALVGFENDFGISKANVESTVAAVEFVFPRFKDGLKLSRVVLAGWAVADAPAHTRPMSSEIARLMAAHFSMAWRE